MNIQVKIDKPKSYIRELTVSFPYSIYENEEKKVVEKYRKNAIIAGFRKGRAPVSIVYSKFKKDIKEEVMTNVIEYIFPKILKEHNLSPISVADIKDFNVSREKEDVTFKASFQVVPEFTLKLDGIRTVYKPQKVKEEDIKKALSELQEKYTLLRESQKPSKVGDSIEINYRVYDDKGELRDSTDGFVLECMKGNDATSIFDLLLNSKVGEKKRGVIVYPDFLPVVELHGEKVNIEFEVVNVKEKIIPPIDDDFAKTLGMESLKELENAIRSQMEEENEQRARYEGEKKFVEKLLKLNDFELPDALRNYYLAEMEKELKDDKYDKEKLIKIAEDKARFVIILDKVAEEEKIEITDDELTEVLKEESKDKSVDVEKIKEYLVATGKIDEIVIPLKREKAREFLLKNFLIRG